MLSKVYYPVVAAFLLFALIMGMTGAILDQHFLDRYPWHDHIFFDSPVSHHHHVHSQAGHPYGHDHVHDDALDRSDLLVISLPSGYASMAYWAMISLGLGLLLCLPQAIERSPLIETTAAQRLHSETGLISPS